LSDQFHGQAERTIWKNQRLIGAPDNDSGVGNEHRSADIELTV
jgi:hypothetical protein